MEEGKIATAQFATERSPSMYIRMRATLSNTLLAWQVGINFSEPASRFTSAIERSGKWKKVR
jgi:hypothetical protein